jgi:hypothetical protein
MDKTEKIIDFIKSKPKCTIQEIGDNLEMNNILPLYGSMKTLIKQGLISITGSGKNAQYEAIKGTGSEENAEGLIVETHKTTVVVAEKKATTEKSGPKEDTVNTLAPSEDEGSSAGKRHQGSYKFTGKDYKKGPLALAVVKKAVEQNPEMTLEELKSAFPDEIVKYYGICQTLKFGKEKSGKYYQRYFMKEDQIIKLNDGMEVVVTNQWTKEGIDKFIAHVKKMGYKIK